MTPMKQWCGEGPRKQVRFFHIHCWRHDGTVTLLLPVVLSSDWPVCVRRGVGGAGRAAGGHAPGDV